MSSIEILFYPQYWFLWAIVLTVALFWPVRHLLWVLYVRRQQRHNPLLTDDVQCLHILAFS